MSSTTIAALAVAATIQIILLLVALRLWLTTPEDRFTLGRWQWLAIIVCLSMVGPIAFLEAPRAERSRGSVEDAVADIYGPGPR